MVAMIECNYAFRYKRKHSWDSEEIPSKKQDLDQFDINRADFIDVIRWLSQYWKTSELIREDLRGPVLVIFRERHNNNESKKENFLAFKDLKNYFNFLWTEWGNAELVWPWFAALGVKVEQMVEFILGKGNYNFSSEAIEDYYGQSVDTYWVDLPAEKVWELRKKAIELAYAIPSAWLRDIPEQKDKKREIVERVFDEYLTQIIRVRNSLWIENTINILIKRWNNGYWKNFIALVSGYEHADDLWKQAIEAGFKWYIIMTPNSLIK